jgi:hypothetical protein
MKRFDCEQAELEWEKAMKIFKAAMNVAVARLMCFWKRRKAPRALTSALVG